jgi:hypothetical protein
MGETPVFTTAAGRNAGAKFCPTGKQMRYRKYLCWIVQGSIAHRQGKEMIEIAVSKKTA